MTEYEFMPGMDDDDPIVLPGGEIHTVGQARADRKLQRRINFVNFMRSGLRDKLVRVLQRSETEPDLDQRDQLWVMREDAVEVALAAFDKIEGIEKRRRHNGQITRAERSPARTKAKHEARWGKRAREVLREARGTISAAHIHPDWWRAAWRSKASTNGRAVRGGDQEGRFWRRIFAKSLTRLASTTAPPSRRASKFGY